MGFLSFISKTQELKKRYQKNIRISLPQITRQLSTVSTLYIAILYHSSYSSSFHLRLGFHIYMHFIIHYFFVKSIVDIYFTKSLSFLYISHPRGIDSDCLRYYG